MCSWRSQWTGNRALGLALFGFGLASALKILRRSDVGGADAAVVQRRGDEGRVASRLRDLHEIVPSADAAAGDEPRSWRG